MRALDKISYWVLDVDGTMTDGSIYYDEHGNECKKFNVKDAAGFFAAHALDMKVVVLTGRECRAVVRRMTELQVDFLCQGQKDKAKFLDEFMTEHAIAREEVAYIGDDLNDYSAMQLGGFVACPADACAEVKEIADYISVKPGGQGAVRDIIEYVLRERGEWETAAAKAYRINRPVK